MDKNSPASKYHSVVCQKVCHFQVYEEIRLSYLTFLFSWEHSPTALLPIVKGPNGLKTCCFTLVFPDTKGTWGQGCYVAIPRLFEMRNGSGFLIWTSGSWHYFLQSGLEWLPGHSLYQSLLSPKEKGSGDWCKEKRRERNAFFCL